MSISNKFSCFVWQIRRNLRLNIESCGYTALAFKSAPAEKTDEVIAENPGKKLVPYYTVQEFVESL